jgi:tRNA(Ile)-lysidine synthase
VSQYCVAYSGGMDSHVLLFLLSQLKQNDSALQLRAVHVNHGLQADSERWAEHARIVCEVLEIPLEIRLAVVDDQSEGPEAAARKARYAEFSEILRPGEHLLLAQHAEDQAETFLLQALRGSGLDGLSGIPRKRRFSVGYIGRPLLACSLESLSIVASTHDLIWIEDPSNLDDKFDRNYLRLNVMPLLKERWPAYAQTLGRSALRSAAASQTLLGLAQQDLAALTIEGTSELSIAGLNALPKERAFTALRLFVRQKNLRMPRLQDLMQVMGNLVDARPDSNGIVNVRDYVFRRHKDSLYVLPQQEDARPFHYTWDAPYEPLTICETGLTLTLALCHQQGLQLPPDGSVTVKSRVGGELLRMGEPAFHKSVKKILQESSLPPWVRDTIPLIYSDGRLAAVLGVAISVDFQTTAAHLAGDVAGDNSSGNR